jgi:Uma2 family endonuclease
MTLQASIFDRRAQHFVMAGLDWNGYTALLSILGDQRVFVTYDRGKVELMYPSFEHENRSETLAIMIRSIADGLRLKVRSGGSTTFNREDLDRGLEPDKCFYIANEQLVRLKKEIDLSIDPPPDLCIEVEISRRLLDRAAIYAGLGVPELWRDDGQNLRLYKLTPDLEYIEIDRSIAFPQMTARRMNHYMDRAHGLDEITWSHKVKRSARKLLS